MIQRKKHMKNQKQFELFPDQSGAHSDDQHIDAEQESGGEQKLDERAALWEAEKEVFGTKTDEEKKKAKEMLKSFIKEEKRRIFGKADDELL